MLDTSLSARYARALYSAAAKQGAVSTVIGELGGFVKLLSGERLLKTFLFHPAISPAEKKGLLAESIGKGFSALTANFLSILLDSKRIGYLESIFLALVEKDNRNRNIVKVRVASAFPIERALLDRIGSRLASLLQKDIDLVDETDPALLGGLKVTIEDQVIDGTLRYRLKQMQEKIALG